MHSFNMWMLFSVNVLSSALWFVSYRQTKTKQNLLAALITLLAAVLFAVSLFTSNHGRLA